MYSNVFEMSGEVGLSTCEALLSYDQSAGVSFQHFSLFRIPLSTGTQYPAAVICQHFIASLLRRHKGAMSVTFGSYRLPFFIFLEPAAVSATGLDRVILYPEEGHGYGIATTG